MTAPEPPGFTCTDDFLNQATEQALLAYLSSLRLEPIVIGDNASRRATGHFGLQYDYRSGVAAPHTADPERAVFADIPQCDRRTPVNALSKPQPAIASSSARMTGASAVPSRS